MQKHNTFRLSVAIGSLSLLMLFAGATKAYAQCGVDVRGKRIFALPRPYSLIKCLETHKGRVPGVTMGEPRKFSALKCEADRLQIKYLSARNKHKHKILGRKLKKLRASIATATNSCNRAQNFNNSTQPTPTPQPQQNPRPHTFFCRATGRSTSCTGGYGGWFSFPTCITFPAFGLGTGSTLNEAIEEAMQSCGASNCSIESCS